MTDASNSALVFPASFAQQRMWFFHRLDPANPYYNIPLVLRVSGDLDPVALDRALNRAVERHEALRTTFDVVDGEAVQIVHDEMPIELAVSAALVVPSAGPDVFRAPEVQEAIRRRIDEPFDLAEGPPLRAFVLELGPRDHVFVLCLHHIVTDGWSFNVLTRDLAALYREEVTGEAAALPEPAIQYADFSEWQAERLSGDVLAEHLDHWRTRLAGPLPRLRLPTDRPHPPEASYRGARAEFELSVALTAELRALGRRTGATPFMVLLAGFTALLQRYTGQDDILVGTPVSGRDMADLEPLVGLFTNTLVLRTDLSGNPSFGDLTARVREACTAAYAHQELPLDKLVQELQPDRDLGGNPLFQVMFALQTPPRLDHPLPGARMSAVEIERRSTRFDLELHLWEHEDRFTGAAVYSTDLFDAQTVTRLTAHLHTLLAAAVAAPELPLAELPLLSESERAGTPGTSGRAFDPSVTVPALFEATAALHPDAVAVRCDAGETTYGRLRELVHATADRLRRHGVAADERVAVHVAPGTDALVATLAVVSLGASAVPVDPALPARACRAWLRRSGVGYVLSHVPAGSAGQWFADVPVVPAAVWAGVDGRLTDRGATDVDALAAGGDRPAFVVGSPTGPIAREHAALGDLALVLGDVVAIGPGDVLPWSAAPGQERGVRQLLWALAHGATLDAGAGAVERATVLLTGGEEAAAGAPRAVVVDGERPPERAATGDRALYRLVTAPASGRAVLLSRHSDAEPEPFGTAHAVPDTLVLDDLGRPVPTGATGEIAVVDSTYRPQGWVGTGLRGRRRSDGRLTVEYPVAGHAHIAGYDVAAAEIEDAFTRDPVVRDCVVRARTDDSGLDRLVAYLVPAGPYSLDRVRERAGQYLPSRLVPDDVVALTDLPRTADGAVDTAALDAVPVLDADVAARWERMLSALPDVREVAVTTGPARAEVAERVHVGRVAYEAVHEATRSSSAADTDAGTAGPESIAVGPGRPEPTVRTLTEALVRAAGADRGGLVHVRADGSTDEHSYRDLRLAAERALAGLRAAGLGPGDRAILQCADNADFLTAFWACVLGGLVPVPLAPAPAHHDDAASVARFEAAWRMLDRPVVLADPTTATALRGLGERRDWVGLRVFDTATLNTHEPAPDHHVADPEDVAVLLLTSGSTGVPKAVRQRHRNILARCAGTVAVNELGPDDVSFNWMPLDHVGGVVMFHVRDVYLGCRQVHAPTTWVLEEPTRWPDALHRWGATVTWAPNFAFGLVNDQAQSFAGRTWDLSHVRYVINAGEAIMARVARRFLHVLAPFGLPADAVRPAWGMSETSSAVTYSTGFTLASTADTDSFVVVGRPTPGTRLRIVDGAGAVVPEGVVGRLQINGPTVTSGYLADDEANRESFTTDGWFETGDLGIIRAGALTITGRAKDVIIVNGVNHYSHEIESVVETLDCVEKSWTAACTVREPGGGGERLAVFFHPRAGADPRDALRRVRAEVVRRTGIDPDPLLAVERADIPKTEIGKIQRSRLRARFEAGEFAELVARTDLLLANERTVPAWFHRTVWRRAAPCAATVSSDPVVVFADRAGLAEHVLAQLAARGRRGIRVDRGDDVVRVSADHYRAPWGSGTKMLELLREVGSSVREFVHLDTYGPADPSDPTDPRAVPDPLTVLTTFAQSLAGWLGSPDANGESVRLLVVGTGAAGVRPDDLPDPARATLTGLVAALAQETPWLHCAHLDLDPRRVDSRADAAHVLTELDARRSEPAVAIRDGDRVVRRLARWERGRVGAPAFRRDGFYLLSGGLGGLGAEIAAHLLDTYGVRLLIVGRTALPDECEWDAHIAEGGETGLRLAALRGLRARSPYVRYENVDVCDPGPLGAAVARAGAAWDRPLAGVVHLAGVFRHVPIADQTAADLAAVARPKTAGTRALYGLIAEDPDALFVGFSSVNGCLGGSMVGAYSAANSYLDAFARRAGAIRASGGKAPRVLSLAWTMWDEVGMSRGYRLAELSRSRGFRTLGRAEAIASFGHVLNQDGDDAHVIIGLDPDKPWVRSHLDAPVRAVHALTASVVRADSAGAVDLGSLAWPTDRFGRPVPIEIASADGLDRSGTAGSAASTAAPAGDLERLVSRLWCQVLGVDRIGRDENFFELGGHSLQMTRVHALLEQELGRSFPMVEMFHSPTVATLAAHLAGGAGEAEPSAGRGRDRGSRRRAAVRRR